MDDGLEGEDVVVEDAQGGEGELLGHLRLAGATASLDNQSVFLREDAAVDEQVQIVCMCVGKNKNTAVGLLGENRPILLEIEVARNFPKLDVRVLDLRLDYADTKGRKIGCTQLVGRLDFTEHIRKSRLPRFLRTRDNNLQFRSHL